MVDNNIRGYNQPTVVLVTGDRAWKDIDTMRTALSQFNSGTVLVHGWAVGADTIADEVGTGLGFKIIRCPSHWRHNESKWVKVHGHCPEDCKEVCGRPAGVIRNGYMLDTHSPTIVLGFHNAIDDSTGTKDMMIRAQKAGIKNVLYTSFSEPVESPVLTRKKKDVSLKPVEDDFFIY